MNKVSLQKNHMVQLQKAHQSSQPMRLEATAPWRLFFPMSYPQSLANLLSRPTLPTRPIEDIPHALELSPQMLTLYTHAKQYWHLSTVLKILTSEQRSNIPWLKTWLRAGGWREMEQRLWCWSNRTWSLASALSWPWFWKSFLGSLGLGCLIQKLSSNSCLRVMVTWELSNTRVPSPAPNSWWGLNKWGSDCCQPW